MRIPLTNIWRAFPELDRFTDEQCERFVRAACKRGWGRHVHRALIAIVTLLLWAACFFGWIYAVDIAGDGRWARRLPDVLAYFVAPVIAFSIPAVVMLVLKDLFLRRRIRYVIRARGTCPACRYSLLGIVVSAGNIVICPECGIEVEADPSLNELSTDELGRARFTPTEKIRVRLFWTPKRLRRLKRAAIVLAVFVFLGLPAGWGVYELFLFRQAKTAAAERPGVAGVMEFIESHQPPGTTASDTNAWVVFFDAQMLRGDITAEVSARPKYSSEDRVIHWPYFDEIYDPTSGLSDEQMEENRLSRELAEALLIAYHESGVLDKIDSLASAPRAVLPLMIGGNRPLFEVLLPELGKARELCRINSARMHLALLADDRDEFLAAFETNLALARMLYHQVFLIEALVANAIEGLTYDRLRHAFAHHPDADWLDGIEAAIARQRASLPRDYAIQGERLAQLDMLAWTFSEPSRVRLGRFSNVMRDYSDLGLADLANGRLGSYTENRDEMNSYFDAMSEAVLLDPFERPAPANYPSDMLLLEQFLPAMDRALVPGDHLEAQRRGTTIMLALERHYLAHGVYPDALSTLVPEHLTLLPVDPWTGKPLRYRLTPGEGIGYVLYSVGPDGTDDGGQPDSVFGGRSNRNPDLILSPQAE